MKIQGLWRLSKHIACVRRSHLGLEINFSTLYLRRACDQLLVSSNTISRTSPPIKAPLGRFKGVFLHYHGDRPGRLTPACWEVTWPYRDTVGSYKCQHKPSASSHWCAGYHMAWSPAWSPADHSTLTSFDLLLNIFVCPFMIFTFNFGELFS